MESFDEPKCIPNLKSLASAITNGFAAPMYFTGYFYVCAAVTVHVRWTIKENSIIERQILNLGPQSERCKKTVASFLVDAIMHDCH